MESSDKRSEVISIYTKYKNIMRAKEIFNMYEGSYFHMIRDMLYYEEYMSYKIPRNLEKKWMMEIIENYKWKYENEKSVRKCDLLLFSILSGIILLKDINELRKIMLILEEENKKLDTLSKISVIGSILEALKYFEEKIRYEIIWRLYHILNKIKSQPIEILEDFILDSNQTKIAEEEILRRIFFRFKIRNR